MEQLCGGQSRANLKQAQGLSVWRYEAQKSDTGLLKRDSSEQIGLYRNSNSDLEFPD
jgi:hypothetical protein